MVIDNVNAETLMPIVLANAPREATIMTDEHSGYRHIKAHFAGHGTTTHSAGQGSVAFHPTLRGCKSP
jgi:hypothetical protein